MRLRNNSHSSREASPTRKASPKKTTKKAARQVSFSETDSIAFFEPHSTKMSRESSIHSASALEADKPSDNDFSILKEQAKSMNACVVAAKQDVMVWPNGQMYEGPLDKKSRPDGQGYTTLPNGARLQTTWKKGECTAAVGARRAHSAQDVQPSTKQIYGRLPPPGFWDRLLGPE